MATIRVTLTVSICTVTALNHHLRTCPCDIHGTVRHDRRREAGHLWHCTLLQVAATHHMHVSHVLRQLESVSVLAYVALSLDVPVSGPPK